MHLKVTQTLRAQGVVGKFVEFFGPGVAVLPLADRATIANMAPEYGATCGFFPVDEETLDYMRLTGREEEQIQVVKQYLVENDMFFTVDNEEPVYSEVVEIDLSEIEPNLAGPKRPQDLIPLSDMQREFNDAVVAPEGNQGFGLSPKKLAEKATINFEDGRSLRLKQVTLQSLQSLHVQIHLTHTLC